MRLRVQIAAMMMGACFVARAQVVCTTQAKMAPDTRQAIADVALSLASATKAGDAAKVHSQTSALAGDFSQVQYTIGSVSSKIQGDSPRVAQVYLLDANKLKAGDDANFSCELTGGTSETDFSISGLTAGVYSFAMVELEGARPWLLSFLLQQEGATWKMAGLYQHPRTAAGKDGLAFWMQARQQKAAEPWLSWLSYGEAVALLSPAPFATSTNLEKLRAEQRQNAPSGLADGVTVSSPLVVKSASGAEIKITSLGSDTTEDGQTLRLVVRYAAGATDTQTQDMAAVKALLAGHPELRQAFGAVLVFGDISGQNPTVLSAKMAEISQ